MKSRNDQPFRRCLFSHFGERSEEFSDELVERLHALWNDATLLGMGSLCLGCGETEGVALEGADTAYCPTEEDPDPNAPIPLCRSCAEEHHAHWKEMWDEYHAGLL
jgi:hypothetical protein